MSHFHHYLQADVLTASQLMRWEILCSQLPLDFRQLCSPDGLREGDAQHTLGLFTLTGTIQSCCLAMSISQQWNMSGIMQQQYSSFCFNVLYFTGKHSLWEKSIFNKGTLGSWYFQYELCFKCEYYSWWILCKLLLLITSNTFSCKMMAFRWNINVKAFWKRIKTQFMKNKLGS